MKAPSDYPKVLYKGKHYTEWSDFCDDLAKREIQSFIVTSESQEKAKRAEGFTDAATLMEPEESVEVQAESVKRRGMPKGGWPKKVDVNLNA